MFKRIVVGTDGSNTARAAVEHAVNLAKASDAEVIVATVMAKPGTSPFEGSTIELGRRILDEVKQTYGKEVALKTKLLEGNAADEIIDLAEQQDADVIVIGNVGMTEKKRFMLGNVPNAISHHAGRHVLIVHTGA